LGTPKVQTLRKKAQSVDEVLTRLYGRQDVDQVADPLDTLVETILSQNTTDANSHRCFRSLKKAYPNWNRILDEDPTTIASIIRSGGLADIKAERILAALNFIKRKRGRLELDFLRDKTPSEADEWLSRIKGVGPKTRGIVLLFSLEMPAFPVDTHIHRVTKRLGLIGPRVSREKAQHELALLVPSREYYSFHINLIQHGRMVCHPRKPECVMCKISRYCDFYSGTSRTQT